MSDNIDHQRRRFVGSAAMTLAAAQFALTGVATAQPAKTEPESQRAIKPRTNGAFASLKQINAGLLNVGYAEAGPRMVRL